MENPLHGMIFGYLQFQENSICVDDTIWYGERETLIYILMYVDVCCTHIT